MPVIWNFAIYANVSHSFGHKIWILLVNLYPEYIWVWS